MPPAVAAAGIMAAGAIGGAVLGGNAQKSAANTAAAAQNQAAAAQLQLGQEQLGLNRDIYNANFGILSPFVSNGLSASNSLNALLGLPAGPALTSPLAGTALGTGTVPVGTQSGTPQINPGIGVQKNAIVSQNPLAPAGLTGPAPSNDGIQDGPQPFGTLAGGRTDLGLPTIGPQAIGTGTATAYRQPGTFHLPDGTPFGPGAPSGGTTPHPTTPAAHGPSNAISPTRAFNNFANSAGMQFQLQQGANALNNLYAAHGMVQSGAAMKGINDYAQQTALNNYFMPYLSMLSGQQNMGAQAGSAIAGVGSNFGNTAAAISGQMGNALQSGADARSNAALASGMANSNMYAGIGSALGQLGSSFIPTGSAFGSAPAGSGIVSNYHYTGTFGGY